MSLVFFFKDTVVIYADGWTAKLKNKSKTFMRFDVFVNNICYIFHKDFLEGFSRADFSGYLMCE